MNGRGSRIRDDVDFLKSWAASRCPAKTAPKAPQNGRNARMLAEGGKLKTVASEYLVSQGPRVVDGVAKSRLTAPVKNDKERPPRPSFCARQREYDAELVVLVASLRIRRESGPLSFGIEGVGGSILSLRPMKSNISPSHRADEFLVDRWWTGADLEAGAARRSFNAKSPSAEAGGADRRQSAN